MEYSARDENWADLERRIKSSLSELNASTADIDWAVMIFASALSERNLEDTVDRHYSVDFLREQLAETFDKEDYMLMLAIRRLDNDSLINCWRAVVSWLKSLGEVEKRDFAVYLIDGLISRETGYEANASRVVAQAVKGIFDRRSDAELVDITPSSGDLFIATQDTFQVRPYLVRSKGGSHSLVELKLRLCGISFDKIDFERMPRELSEKSVCVIDFNSISLRGYLSPASPSDPFMILGDLIRQEVRGRFVIVTPLQKDKKFRSGAKILTSLLKYVSINGIIRYSAPVKNIALHALIVIAEGRSNAEKDHAVLQVDVAKGNNTLPDLTYLEAANLGVSIFRKWQNPHWASSEVLQNVQRFLNANFERGYKDIPDLCKEVHGSRRQQIELIPLKEPDESRKAKYQPSLLINSDPVLAELNDHQQYKCVYIIGNNGEGKSFLLRDLVHLLVEDGRKCFALTISQSDRFPSESEGVGGSYRRLGEYTSNSKRSECTTRALLSMVGKFDQRFEVFTEAMSALGFNENIYLVRKGKAETQNIASKTVIPLRYFSIQHHADPDDARDIDPAKYEIGIVPKNEDNIIPFSRLSSGERNIIQLVTMLISSAERGGIYFIDEPEISLHVKWQQVLPSIFTKISETHHLSVIVATHSPVIVANADHTNSVCYLAQGGVLKYIEPGNRHSVETILLQGFKTYTPHNREVHEKCAKLVSDIIEQVNTDPNRARGASRKAISELNNITAIIKNTGQRLDDTQERGDLDLITKAIAAIRSVVSAG